MGKDRCIVVGDQVIYKDELYNVIGTVNDHFATIRRANIVRKSVLIKELKLSSTVMKVGDKVELNIELLTKNRDRLMVKKILDELDGYYLHIKCIKAGMADLGSTYSGLGFWDLSILKIVEQLNIN